MIKNLLNKLLNKRDAEFIVGDLVKDQDENTFQMVNHVFYKDGQLRLLLAHSMWPTTETMGKYCHEAIAEKCYLVKR